MVSRFKHKLPAIYILYGVCTQTCLIYGIRRDLIQPKHVQCIVSGGKVYSILHTASGTQAVQRNKTANKLFYNLFIIAFISLTVHITPNPPIAQLIMYSKYFYSLTTDYNNMLAGVLNLVNT